MLALGRGPGLGGGREVECFVGAGSSQGGLGKGPRDKRGGLSSLGRSRFGAGRQRSLGASNGGGSSAAGRGARWPRCRVGSRGAAGC